MTGHAFIRPGQVAPDRPAPDRCVACGLPESDHGAWQVFIHSGDDTSSYIVHAADELTAAAIAGAAHGGPVDEAEIEPWTAP